MSRCIHIYNLRLYYLTLCKSVYSACYWGSSIGGHSVYSFLTSSMIQGFCLFHKMKASAQGKEPWGKNKLLFFSPACSSSSNNTRSEGKPKWVRYTTHTHRERKREREKLTAVNALIWSIASLWSNEMKPTSVSVTNILWSVLYFIQM